MIYVLVETTFVQTLILERDEVEACRRLLEACQRGDYTLRLPAFSLMEPVHTLVGEEKKRTELSSALEREVGEYLREQSSYPQEARTIQRGFNDFVLNRTVSHFQRLQDVSANVMGNLIPLDEAVLREIPDIRSTTELKLPDSYVLASVLAYVKGLDTATEKWFVTTDKHFGSDAVRTLLRPYNCQWMARFSDATRRLQLEI